MKIARTYGKPILISLTAILISLLLGWLIIAAIGGDSNSAMFALWDATFRSKNAFLTTLSKMTPLLFTGIGVAVAYQGNIFNIGAEGQFILGAIFAGWLGVRLGGLPPYLLIPFIMISGAVAGAFWAIIPAILKTRYNVSEIISTIMMNYIAVQLLGFCVRGPLQQPGINLPQSEEISNNANLPALIKNSDLTIGFLLSILTAVIMYIILYKTNVGYKIRVVGLNKTAARCAGIRVNNNILCAMALSGIACGLGGVVQTLGTSFRLYEGVASGYGYSAIAISLLANNNPLGVILSSFFFGALDNGSALMQRRANITPVFVDMLQAIMVLTIACATAAAQYALFSSKKKMKASAKGG